MSHFISPFQLDFIAFKLNSISIIKWNIDMDAVTDITCTRKVLLHGHRIFKTRFYSLNDSDVI